MSIGELIVTPSAGSEGIGAVLTQADLNDLANVDVKAIKEALLRYSVLVFPNAQITPENQVRLHKLLDPDAQDQHANGSKQHIEKANVLSRNGGARIPGQPQIQIIGNGPLRDYLGVESADLVHMHHSLYHVDKLSPGEEAAGETRFYRWHIDSNFYETLPPLLTSLSSIIAPKGPPQTIHLEDGVLEVPLGATAFISGRRAYQVLSEEDKQFVREAKAVYAPHPYIWMQHGHTTSDGLSLAPEGKELPLDQLPSWEQSKVKALPLNWTNPVTGEPAFMVHGCCIQKLVLPDGKILDKVEDVRAIIHRLQKQVLRAKNVFVAEYKKGDLVMFHNRGVWHATVGSLQFDDPEHRRLLHQLNLVSAAEL